jgi:hypothetical protein
MEIGMADYQHNVGRTTMHATDFRKFAGEFKHSAYLQNPRTMGGNSKRSVSNKMKTGKIMGRRLKSGNSNNRANLSVYNWAQQFVDPIYSNKRKRNANNGKTKSVKNKERDNIGQKPYTAKQERRASILNEQGSSGSIKDNYVASIKQTIAQEETKGDKDNSIVSEKAVANAVLPAVNHEESKRKIEHLMFNPTSSKNEDQSKKIKVLEHIDKNGPETNLNEMPDLTTFDNRNSDKVAKLISNAKGSSRDPNPNKSMKNLKQTDEEVLPIYKRRAYNRGPIKLKDNRFNGRMMYTNYSSKAHNAWVWDQSNNFTDENTNVNNKGPIKGKPYKSDRQRTDFRINKTRLNPKSRGKTANSRRNLKKAESSDAKTPVVPIISAVQPENKVTRVGEEKKALGKRAQSQHTQQRGRFGKEVEVEEVKEEAREESISRDDSKEESKDSKDDEDLIEKVKKAEEKMKRTADEMILAQKEIFELDSKFIFHSSNP